LRLVSSFSESLSSNPSTDMLVLSLQAMAQTYTLPVTCSTVQYL
jgi:hypothetical protein